MAKSQKNSMNALFDDEDQPIEAQAPVVEGKSPGGWDRLPAPGSDSAFPYDGSPIVVTADGRTGVEVIWRKTRRYYPKLMKFIPVGYWAKRNGGGVKIDFEPVAYRRLG